MRVPWAAADSRSTGRAAPWDQPQVFRNQNVGSTRTEAASGPWLHTETLIRMYSRRGLGVLDEHVEVPVAGEHAGVE